jgi:hypothetical protein
MKTIRKYLEYHPFMSTFITGAVLVVVSIVWILGWDWPYVFLGIGVIMMLGALAGAD